MNSAEVLDWIRDKLPNTSKGDAGLTRLYIISLIDGKQPGERRRSIAKSWLETADAPQPVVDFLIQKEMSLSPKIVGYSLNAPMIWGDGYVLLEQYGRVTRAPLSNFLRQVISAKLGHGD